MPISIRATGTSGACLALSAEDTLILSFLPAEEIFAGRDWNMLILLFGMLILFLGMHFAISRLVQENVVQKVESVNASLSRIRAGDLNEKVRVAGNTEFEALSAGINYQTIAKEVGISTATISRVSKCLNYGTGGYGNALEKLRAAGEPEKEDK